MSEILIHDMEDTGGDLIFHGEALPISPEATERMMFDAKIPRPYIAHSYSFRLNELNGQITGSQPLDKLNSLATLLGGLSEYERVKLEGAVLLTDCKTPEDCAKAYADFIDRREYDEAQSALFLMVRTSFTAGWQAAGGNPPSPHKIFEVLPRKEQEREKDEP